jgi:predicted nucleic acid-binding protein
LILVDSSVWIDFLNGKQTQQVSRLRSIFSIEQIGIGDLMLCEVLQGLDSERAAEEVKTLLRQFDVVWIGGDGLAVHAARNFRTLRRRGVTIRKTIDLLIGTWCIANDVPLLHNDSDFRPMSRYLGLREFIPS